MSKEAHIAIEQLDAFEDRLAVALSGVSAEHIAGILYVCGRLDSQSDGLISTDIRICADALDSSGRVLQAEQIVLYKHRFRIFRTFQIKMWYEAERPARVRVYPKLA